MSSPPALLPPNSPFPTARQEQPLLACVPAPLPPAVEPASPVVPTLLAPPAPPTSTAAARPDAARSAAHRAPRARFELLDVTPPGTSSCSTPRPKETLRSGLVGVFVCSKVMSTAGQESPQA